LISFEENVADVDAKPSYRNLLQRVEGYVSKFLYRQNWSATLNKAHLRSRLRSELNESDMLKHGIEHLVDQVVNEKVRTEFKDKIEEALNDFLGIKNEKKVTIVKEEPKIETEENDVTFQSENNDFSDLQSHLHNGESESNTESAIEPQIPEKTEHISEEEDFDGISNENWPTPPKLEITTPEHESPQLDDESVSNSEPEKKFIESEIKDAQKENQNEPEDVCKLSSELKGDNDDFVEESLVVEAPQSDVADTSTNADTINESSQVNETTSKEEVIEPKEDMSDVSSVHTSDLSDFDDEISIEDSDEENEVAKKKISLKVVKKLAQLKESVTEDDNDTHKTEIEEPHTNKTESSEAEEESKEGISQTKRKRKINPRFSSSEFSYNLKSKKVKLDKEDNEEKMIDKEETLIIQESSETVKQLKRKVNSDLEKTEIVVATKRITRSIKSSIVLEKPARPRGRPPKKVDETQSQEQVKPSRNEKSNKRYDSSDLWKPRLSLSSRRTRSVAEPVTPDSNSNSTLEETN